MSITIQVLTEGWSLLINFNHLLRGTHSMIFKTKLKTKCAHLALLTHDSTPKGLQAKTKGRPMSVETTMS